MTKTRNDSASTLYLIEGIQTIDGQRVTAQRCGEAFVRGRAEATRAVKALEAARWLSVRAVAWGDG